MILDKNGRLFGKVSIIDLFVVIMILGIALGTVYKFRAPVTNITGGTKKIDFYVKIRDVREFTAEYYKEGLKAYDNRSGVLLGTITDIEVNKYYDTVINLDGTMTKTEKVGKIEIVLKIEGDGVETSQSYMLGGSYELRAGAGINLLTKYVVVEGYIMGINSK